MESSRRGFFQLKLLLVENSDPWRWDADASHFPNLQQLVLRECHRLMEIPQGIGDITTLQTIEVQDCSFCIIRSAGRIHQQQQMLGNDELGIRIITTSGDNHSASPLHFLSVRKGLCMSGFNYSQQLQKLTRHYNAYEELSEAKVEMFLSCMFSANSAPTSCGLFAEYESKQ
ncbi:putative late blight resistance proteinR1A-10 [Sesamum angolense]|uniref:Late blight resistance proteinR1A-10 n=1 Tax=Sesamum angolense TaxID=2727404 RepID=A0AAE2C4D7_9LAMI|nr:putative late blight resistance proteinR1A-10 [Sesamum angolense]